MNDDLFEDALREAARDYHPPPGGTPGRDAATGLALGTRHGRGPTPGNRDRSMDPAGARDPTGVDVAHGGTDRE